MAIKLFNTLTRQKEDFQPMIPGQVKMYVCGPTVYNYIHIGNARSAVAFDTIRRYLEYRGYQVEYVSNFTDVDDKIIKAASAEGLTTTELADKYIAAFKEDTSALNVKPANIHPRVVDNIPEIIHFIETLIERGHAYPSQGDVYFKTKSFKDYGKLSDQSIESLQVGASERVDADLADRKQDPLDFALWKATKEDGEVSWQSPWGPGRPGWHIECSVMATKYLGDTIDIHGGGQDLQFPHHENEIAQSESCTGHTFANYWLHNGFVTIGQEAEKMSKSLGNFILLRDLLISEDPLVIRYLLTTVHYRRPLSYDEAALSEARVNVERLHEVIRRLDHRMSHLDQDSGSELDPDWQASLDQLESRFQRAMDDDFNTANGMTEIFELTKLINSYLDQAEVALPVLAAMKSLLETLLAIFGLIFPAAELLDDEIQALIEERDQARAAKDYARSDEIRDLLKEQGILLNDTPHGTQWKRVN